MFLQLEFKRIIQMGYSNGKLNELSYYLKVYSLKSEAYSLKSIV
jgi:hypothetical protein